MDVEVFLKYAQLSCEYAQLRAKYAQLCPEYAQLSSEYAQLAKKGATGIDSGRVFLLIIAETGCGGDLRKCRRVLATRCNRLVQRCRLLSQRLRGLHHVSLQACGR